MVCENRCSMITFVDHYFEYEDPRGSITGLINQGNWKEVNLITSSKNSIRGDHYHKRTTELFIILEGEIEVISQRVVDEKIQQLLSQSAILFVVFLLLAFAMISFLLLRLYLIYQ